MAVPGTVVTGRNRGAHALLRDGATLVEAAEDILEELGWRDRSGPLARRAAERTRSSAACSPHRAAVRTRFWTRSTSTTRRIWTRSSTRRASPDRGAGPARELELAGAIVRGRPAGSCVPRRSGNVAEVRLRLSSGRRSEDDMAKPLVIVESPAKAQDPGPFPRQPYRVEASVGHIRDLPESAREIPEEIKDKPWGRLGVDVDGDFKPYYVVPADKRKQRPGAQGGAQGRLRSAAGDRPRPRGRVDQLAPDRGAQAEGSGPAHRLPRDDRGGGEGGDRDARDVDDNLVRAQESRRILDRLYGYTLSPVLWKKVQTGLSAGRVQSVAVRLIVEREEERRAFRTSVYWDLEARLSGEGREFTATLVRVGDERVATGKDFDPATGALKARSVRHLDEARRRDSPVALERNLPWTVTSGRGEAGRRAARAALHDVDADAGSQPQARVLDRPHDADRAAAVPGRRDRQRRDEGLITYHRTDSTTLSDKALDRVGAGHPRACSAPSTTPARAATRRR